MVSPFLHEIPLPSGQFDIYDSAHQYHATIDFANASGALFEINIRGHDLKDFSINYCHLTPTQQSELKKGKVIMFRNHELWVKNPTLLPCVDKSPLVTIYMFANTITIKYTINGDINIEEHVTQFLDAMTKQGYIVDYKHKEMYLSPIVHPLFVDILPTLEAKYKFVIENKNRFHHEDKHYRFAQIVFDISVLANRNPFLVAQALEDLFTMQGTLSSEGIIDEIIRYSPQHLQKLLLPLFHNKFLSLEETYKFVKENQHRFFREDKYYRFAQIVFDISLLANRDPLLVAQALEFLFSMQGKLSSIGVIDKINAHTPQYLLNLVTPYLKKG